MLDLTAAQRATVSRQLRLRLPRATAVAYGSRVLGWPFGRGPKPWSDLDIALWGLTSADAAALAHLRADFDDSALPWRVDLTDAGDLAPALSQLVSEHGEPLQGQWAPAVPTP